MPKFKSFLILAAVILSIGASDSFAACRGGRIRAAIFHPLRVVKHCLTTRSGQLFDNFKQFGNGVGCSSSNCGNAAPACADGQCRPGK